MGKYSNCQRQLEKSLTEGKGIMVGPGTQTVAEKIQAYQISSKFRLFRQKVYKEKDYPRICSVFCPQQVGTRGSCSSFKSFITHNKKAEDNTQSKMGVPSAVELIAIGRR
jgi:hypothetical protein